MSFGIRLTEHRKTCYNFLHAFICFLSWRNWLMAFVRIKDANEFLEVILTTHDAMFLSSGSQSPSETNQNWHLYPWSLSSLSSVTENIKTESIEACFIKIKISGSHQRTWSLTLSHKALEKDFHNQIFLHIFVVQLLPKSINFYLQSTSLYWAKCIRCQTSKQRAVL